MDTISGATVQPPTQFRIDVNPQQGAVHVVPIGELDVDTTHELQARLDELRSSGFEDVVLDLRKLTFLETTGIALLVAEAERARSIGFSFDVIEGQPAIQRVLDLCGVRAQLRLRHA